VFLHSLERGCFPQSWCSSPMKTLAVRQCFFQKLTQLTMLNILQVPLAWNIKASLTRAAVLLPFTWLGWFSTRWCSPSRKTLRDMQYSFKEQTEFTILTKFLDPLVSNIKDPLTNLQIFSHLLVCGDFPQSWCSSPMNTLAVRQGSFQKLPQFTMLKKVQGPLTCNLNASLTRAAVLLLFTWMGWFSTKLMLLIQENTER
jgi:hypothetical protein